MATVHMILQGKGGVGKSFIASTITQYLKHTGHAPICIDTDPVNRTFSGYKAFDVKAIELVEGTDVNPRRFDQLVEIVLAAEPEQHVVVDNGASSFLPLSDYMRETHLPSELEDEGHSLTFHTVITGGQGMVDTLEGLAALVKMFPDVPCVVWLNPVHGPVEYDGRGFEDLGVYRNHAERITGLVTIPTLNPKTFGRDLGDLLCARRTFEEAEADASLDFMGRSRLRRTWRQLQDSIAASGAL